MQHMSNSDLMAQRETLSFPASDREWLEPYLPLPTQAEHQQCRPFVTLTFATSLDSAIALRPGQQTVLSGPQSKAMTHYLRSRHDAILVGVGTAVADNPSLNCRTEGAGGYGGPSLHSQPRPVVVDPKGRWMLEDATKILKLAKEGKGKAPWIVTTISPGSEQRRVLEDAGGQFIILEGQGASGASAVSWNSILTSLSDLGISSIMIEGGGTVINTLLHADQTALIDSVIVTIAPTWLGQGGVVISPGRTHEQDSNNQTAARLKDAQWHQLGEDIVLCGRI